MPWEAGPRQAVDETLDVDSALAGRRPVKESEQIRDGLISPPPLSLSLSLSLSSSLSLSFFHSLSLTLTLSRSHSLTLTLTLL